MKKVRNKIVVVLIFTLLMLVLQTKASAAETANLKVSTASGEKDDTVEITVSLENDTNFVAGNFNLIYDTTKLEYVSYEFGSVFNEGIMKIINHDSTTGNIAAAFSADPSEASHVRSAGNLFTVKFKIISDTTGITNFTFNCTTLKQNDGTNVTTDITDGYVNVIKKVKTVNLNKNTVTLERGTAETLTATYAPADTTEDTTVTWASSKEAVATVDNTGKVTAVAPGQATITATIGDVSDECTVDVIATLTDITLSKTNLDLLKKQSEKITVSYVPADTTSDKTVTWSSSDETVATVSDDGTITGVSEGTAVVTATCGSISKTVTVHVTEILLESIAINKTTVELDKGDTDTLSVLINPENTTDATSPITWNSSDETIVKVDSTGKITAVSSGTATITAKIGSKTAQVTVTVKQEETTNTEVVDNTTTNTVANIAATTDTTNTTNTATTTVNTATSGTLPKTGDLKIGLYIMVALAGVAGVVYIIRKRK